MKLDIQVLSLAVSFGFGIYLYILLELCYRFLTSSSLIVKILSSLIFVLFNSLVYFIILLYINNGYIHLYFFLAMLLGYILCKVIYKWFVNKNIL